MSIKKDGIMVILSSPSGAGKTTLVKLLSKNKDFSISVSHTTREPRINEIPDQDYYFVDYKKFQTLIDNEEFLDIICNNGSAHGVPYSDSAQISTSYVEFKNIFESR